MAAESVEGESAFDPYKAVEVAGSCCSASCSPSVGVEGTCSARRNRLGALALARVVSEELVLVVLEEEARIAGGVAFRRISPCGHGGGRATRPACS